MINKLYRNKYTKFVMEKDPFYITISYVVFIFAVLFLIIYFPLSKIYSPFVFKIISILLPAIPLFITFNHIRRYKKVMTNLYSLASLYLQIIVLFGMVYFVGMTEYIDMSLKAGLNYAEIDAPISGISCDWYKMVIEKNPDKTLILKKALKTMQDCLHFSLVTSATVGYGDMVPIKPGAKLLVDIQILVSLFIMAFGLGIFFSRHDTGKRTVIHKVEAANFAELIQKWDTFTEKEKQKVAEQLETDEKHIHDILKWIKEKH